MHIHELYMIDVKEMFNFNCVNLKLSFKCIDNYLRPKLYKAQRQKSVKKKAQESKRQDDPNMLHIQICLISGN